MQVGCRFLVSKPVTPNPNRILYLSNEVLRFFDQIRRDLVVIWRNLGQISPDPARFHPDLAGSGQISSRSRRIWPDFVPSDKPNTDSTRPETDESRTEKSNHLSGSVSGHIFLHPNRSGWFRVGYKTDPARSVYTPIYAYIWGYKLI